MSEAQVTKPVRVMAGLYKGTMTVDGQTFPYEVERAVVGINCDPGDGGWWRVITNHEASDWYYPTMAEALESLKGGWEVHPTWGLCRE